MTATVVTYRLMLPADAASDASASQRSPAWITDNREGGVFGVIGRVSIRAGRKTGTLLGRAHPGAVWLEWTG